MTRVQFFKRTLISLLACPVLLRELIRPMPVIECAGVDLAKNESDMCGVCFFPYGADQDRRYYKWYRVGEEPKS